MVCASRGTQHRGTYGRKHMDTKLVKNNGVWAAMFLTGLTASFCHVQDAIAALPGAAGAEQCSRGSAPARKVDAVLDGISTIVVRTTPSQLRVVGAAAHTELVALATTCDRDKDATVILEATREGSRVYVVASSDSDRGPLLGPSTNLRVTLTVPHSVKIEIENMNGPTTIEGVSAVSIGGGMGSLRINDIAGDVAVRNGVGAAYLARIAGDLQIEDGSGELIVSGVDGMLRILADAAGQMVIDDVHRDVVIDADGSGEIRVSRVSGDVRVGRDGSGKILVSGVGGNLTVADKTRGLIKYEHVAGSVHVPRLETAATGHPRR